MITTLKKDIKWDKTIPIKNGKGIDIMEKILLKQNIQSNLTIIPNEFIDSYMVKADGEFVKIYLLLVRLLNQGAYTGPDQLADLLELTLKDVQRALNYWTNQGLLSQEEEGNTSQNSSDPEIHRMQEKVPDLTTLAHVRQTPAKQKRNPSEMAASIQGTDLEQTLYMTETYIGHPLSQNEIASIYYIDKDLHFDTDLLQYLIEYCVTKGKANIRYIESVAINWYQNEIDTVKKAREYSAAYTKNVFPVMKAFGISGRNPAPSELEFIRSWNDMGFDTDILLEACNRTMLQTHQASFPYANRILESWKQAGVRTLDDVKIIDKNHQLKKPAAGSYETRGRKAVGNAFHNFEQRSYDYDDLEARLLDLKRSGEQ